MIQTAINNNNTKIELNSVQLEDIPFQLCLTGITTTEENDDNDNEMEIHNKQQLFLQFMELVNLIRDILYKLSISGHPSYQDCQLIN